VPVSGSSITSTCRVAGHSDEAMRLAIHSWLGGSRNSSDSQRQVGWRTAARSAASIASTSAGTIGPTITAAIWLRSISTNGISRFSPSATLRILATLERTVVPSATRRSAW
jgi:hypothetical protein